jgi:subtilisin family serine protease
MRRTLLGVILVSLGLFIGAARTHAVPGGPAAQVSVIVTLRAQPDLNNVSGTRADRLRTVIQRAQATADREQRPFLAQIEGWKHAGLVTSVTPYWIFDGFAITAAPEVVTALEHNPAVASVTPDGTMTAATMTAPAAAAEEWNVARVDAPALWSLGRTGQGIVVASLDTGVDVTHPDLAGGWRGGSDSWYDPFGQHPSTPVDLSGHGTQVMGVMVGGSAGGTSIGVAPGATWIAARIYNDRGKGTASATHLAFQWLLDPDHDPTTADAPQVVDNSWTYGSGCNLEFAADIQALRAAGIVPVFAAGNGGLVGGNSPANNPGALAVGATTSSDTIASFSNLGPSACGEPSTTFPELAAPGVSIRTTDLAGGYTTQDGTSLAAPQVAGVLALLLGAQPDLSVFEQEAALEQGAVDLGAPGADNTFGAGRLDALGAYNVVTTTPSFTLSAPSAEASTFAGGSVAFTIASTGRNGFAGDVALSVSAPAGGAVATIAPTVVAGGTGDATVTVATPSSIPPGRYPVTVTGTAGTLSRHLDLLLVVEPPPDFGLAAAPSSVTTVPGGNAVFTTSVFAVSGFSGDVQLSLAGLTSQQATWSFAPASIAGGSGSSQLSIAPSATLAPGTYSLTVTGTSGALSHTAQATLVVNPPPDFTLTALPASLTIKGNNQGSVTVTVSAMAGFSSPVTLSVSGLPSGATGTFSRNPVTPGLNSTLTLRTSAPSPKGTFALTVSGSGGGKTHSSVVTLTLK